MQNILHSLWLCVCVKRQPDIFRELIKLKIENKYFCPDKVNLNNQKFIKIIKEFTIGKKKPKFSGE